MHILAILILLAFPVFANADTQAQNFIPGEPMRFPMKSAGVADNLVELYSVNCKAEDISVQSNCLALLEERGDSCTDQPPEIFEDIDSYRAWASDFSACVFPRPICNGVEVRNERQFSRYCQGSQ